MKFIFFIIILFMISLISSQVDEEEENKKFRAMKEEYEIKIANKPDVEPNQQFLEYKNYIKTQIMNRAILPEHRD